MTDMVERAARGICLQNGINPDEICRDDSDMEPFPMWQLFEDDARAAQEATFKVTDEDAQAFFGCRFASLNWSVRQQQRDFSVAMQALSDAALKVGS